MAENRDGQERSEQATPKRRQEARDKGDVARSRELNTMMMLVAAGICVLVLGPDLVQGLLEVMRTSFVMPREELVHPAMLPDFLIKACLHMLRVLAPFLLVMLLVALAAPAVLGGWVFSAKALGFQWGRLNPAQGIKRVFGPHGLVEMLKALVKFSLIAAVAVLLLWQQLPELMSVGDGSLQDGLARSARLVAWTFLMVSAATILIAAVDVPYQLWQYGRKLKMTRQEVKDEFKDTEGKPEVKARIRSQQAELARRRMMDEVPKADVVVTNPTHYSVALRYDPDRMPAPKVVAKGVDALALRIREAATASRVTVVEAPPLARALYFSTKINQEVPAGLYLAVAQVLAYVFQLRKRSTQGETPPPPKDLPIPDEFKKGEV